MEQLTEPLLEARTQSIARKVSKEPLFLGAAAVPLQEIQGDAGTLIAFLADGSEEKTDPRAEGACLLDLEPEEWRLVRNAPLISFLAVAGADGTVTLRKRRALARAIENGKRSSSEVFQAVCRELHRQRETLVQAFVSDTFEGKQLPEAYELVARKLGPVEAARFKACLMELGRQVAMASGGLFASWGWLRGVERQALAELSTALDARL
jgi:hypothetical protein